MNERGNVQDDVGICDCGHRVGMHVLLDRRLACVVPGCRCGGGRSVALREFGASRRSVRRGAHGLRGRAERF